MALTLDYRTPRPVCLTLGFVVNPNILVQPWPVRQSQTMQMCFPWGMLSKEHGLDHVEHLYLAMNTSVEQNFVVIIRWLPKAFV